MPQSRPPITLALLLQAIGPPGGTGGSPHAFREVHAQLRSVIHARVARVLCKRAPKGRDPRQEVEDAIHEVLVQLIAKDFHALRLWDPTRPDAASLENWVGGIAERVIGGTLRTKSRSPWTNDFADKEVFNEVPADAPSAETLLANEEIRKKVFDAVKRKLQHKPRGLIIFQLRWEQGLSVNEICARLGMTRGAVDAWMARIRKLIDEELARDDD